MCDLPFSIHRLNPEDPRPLFDCGDDDLNEYFHTDSIQSGIELLSVTYVAKYESAAIAYFCLSNDSIRKKDLPNTKRRKLLSNIPRNKHYSSMPAVKIGRFAVTHNKQHSGIGSEILNFLKTWFTEDNKTGCRFIIVDAYNKDLVIKFYRRNGFEFLLSSDEQETTRLMYFDLALFR